jgi:hypothetical protein
MPPDLLDNEFRSSGSFFLDYPRAYVGEGLAQVDNPSLRQPFGVGDDGHGVPLA